MDWINQYSTIPPFLDLHERKRLLRIGEDDNSCLSMLELDWDTVVPGIVDAIHNHLSSFPSIQSWFADEQTTARVKSAQQRHFSQLIKGQLEETYLAQCTRLGEVHKKHNVAPTLYLSAYSQFLTEVLQRLNSLPTTADLCAVLTPLLKSTFMEIGLITDAQLDHERRGLLQANRFQEKLTHHLPLAMMVVDTRLHIINANRYCKDLFGIKHEDIINRSVADVIDDSNLLNFLQQCALTPSSPCRLTCRLTGCHDDNHFQISANPIQVPQIDPHADADGQFEHVILLTLEKLTDTGDHTYQNRKLAAVVEQIDDAVMITDTEGIIEYVNDAYIRLSQFSREELIGKTPRLVKSGIQSRQVYERLWRSLKAGQAFRDVFVNRRKNGELFYEEKTVTPIMDDNKQITHYVSSGKDITQSLQTEQRLHRLINENPVTELPNRYSLMNHLKKCLNEPHRRLTILCINIDRFKLINDMLGFNQADDVLKKITARIKKTLPEGFLANLFADEFIAVIDMNDEAKSSPMFIQQTAKEILHAINAPVIHREQEFTMTASIGISVYPEDGDDEETLIRNAQFALLKPKKLGGNQYEFYNAVYRPASRQRIQFESLLRKATKQSDFSLQYQPQVLLRNSTMVGVEALLRWQHPQRGSISPAEFIPTLEETGMIIEVGEWVLREACSQWMKWNRGDIHISVNVSAVQLQGSEFVETISRVIDATGMPPSNLVLELTESVIFQDIRHAYHVLNTLSLMNIRLAIDDFGTGYSSLNYVRDFPFDYLKLDKSFISEIEFGEDHRTIAEAIINMSRGLRMLVIAEGVENENQIAILHENKCDMIQGYVFSRPRPPEEIALILDGGKKM